MASGVSVPTEVDDIFADELHFPAFDDVSYENDLDERYWYQNPFSGVWVRACTWCFLGEITHDEASQIAMLRNRVFVKDRRGRSNIPVFFYPESGFFRFETLKKGHTLCIMCTEWHHFLDMSIGFRIECLDLVKVIPCSLADLLALSTTYSKCSDPHVCWNCEKKAEKELQKCAACKLARYCNKACQRNDWKQRHRRWCKAVPEFLKMTKINYSVYNESALFSPFGGRIW